MKKIGLTVGKYAPFHKGHQYLMEIALKEMDELIVVVYNAPKSTDIPLNIRANWIRKLYPEVTVIEGWDVPTDKGWSEENQRKHESYIISLLNSIKITAFYSSESYGERMSRALGCQNRIVDMARNAINICATDIRNDAFKLREYLSPVVYRDFVTNVFILGSNDSGKSELTKALSNAHKESGCLIDHFEAYDLTETEFSQFAMDQNTLFFRKINESNRYLFSDSDLITLQLIFKNKYHKNNKIIDSLFAQVRPRYDLVFVCENSHDSIEKCDNDDKFVNQLVSELIALKIPYRLLTGTHESNLETATQILRHYKKFSLNNSSLQTDFQDKVLETERLYLRKLRPSDFESLCMIMQDPITMVAYEHAFSDSEVNEWLLRQFYRYEKHGCGLWAVCLKSTDEMIGQCGITIQKWKERDIHEIGYLFQRSHWHHGYATEAALACKKYAFEVMGLNEVVSIIRDSNLPSQNVAIRNGMKIVDQFIKYYQDIEMPHYVFLVKRNQ